jgi:hypothetical protein
MPSMIELPRRGLLLCGVVSLIAASACGDDGTPPEEEPEIATARVTVGNNSVEINNSTGVQTPATLPLTVNQANQMSVRFLGADGQDEPIVADERANLELRIPNLPTGWGFARTGGSGATFTATITPTQTGSRPLTLQLFSIEHDHEEFQRTLTVNVQ